MATELARELAIGAWTKTTTRHIDYNAVKLLLKTEIEEFKGG